jgi:hypothetical protein
MVLCERKSDGERLPKQVDHQSYPSLNWLNDLHSWPLIVSLLGVQLQSPLGALAERLAQVLAGDEPKLGGGRVAQP